MRHPVAHLVALAASTALALPAQSVPTKTLSKPSVELADPLSGVLEVRERKDGRVVVLDAKDNALYLTNAALTSVSKLAREGSGPTEYRRVVQLLPRPNDTTLAYDIMNARFLVIDGKGVPSSTVSLRDAAGGFPVGPMAVRGYDLKGRLYYQGMKVTTGPNGPSLSDTAPVLRLDPKKKKTDTLAAVRIGSPGMKMSGDVQKGGGSVRLEVPAFPIVDEWGLLPDGRIVVVRGGDYHLELITDAGDVKVLPPVPYTKVAITDADKAELQKAREVMQKEVGKVMEGARSATPNGKMPAFAVEMPSTWPTHKPAFIQTALKIAPNGELWVARLGAANAKTTLHDVFTSAGVLRLRVELPAKTRVVGIGEKYLYAVRSDEDDLQYLQRYPRP